MRTRLYCLLLTPLVSFGGDFINLTFDQPNLNGPLTPIYPGGPLRGNTSDLLRGWMVTAAGQPVTLMTYSAFPIGGGGGFVDLMGNSPENTASPLGFGSLVLHSGQNPTGPELRLSQTGTIPADAAGLWLASGYVQVFANGAKIGEVNPVLGGPSIIDVSPYSGQEVKLEFLVRPGDSIRFDVLGFTSVPEPSTWALVGCGGMALWAMRCLRRS